MTREEQIREAAHSGDDNVHAEQYPIPGVADMFNGYFATCFELGAKWADQHPNWIAVEERLPEKENEFEDYSKLVVVTNGKDFWKGMYDYGGKDWRTYDLWLIDDATHWMEIVPPRKEENNETK